MSARTGILVLATALAATPVVAQETGVTPMESLLQTIRLPRATREARILGVPEQDLRTIFDTVRDRRLPAGILTEVIEEENKSIREHGPVDNFGAFVQSRLQEGLRGRELAAAIRAEHAAHGKGKGPGQVKGPDGKRDDDARPGNSGRKGDDDRPGVSGRKGTTVGEGGKPQRAERYGASGERRETPARSDSVKGKKGGNR